MVLFHKINNFNNIYSIIKMYYPSPNNFINTPREYSLLTRKNINKILRSSTELSPGEKKYIERKLINLGLPVTIEAILNMGPDHWTNIGISPSIGMSVKNAFIKFQELALRKMSRTRDRVLKLVEEKHKRLTQQKKINEDRLRRLVANWKAKRDSKKFWKERSKRLGRRLNNRTDRGPDSYFGEIRTIKKIAATKKNWTLRDVDKLYNLLYKK